MIKHPGAESANRFTPVSAGQVARAAVQLSECRAAGGHTFWLERRPDQGGRTTIMRHDGVHASEILPRDYDCRSRVNEYGGGAYCACGGTVYFINDADQQVYRLDDGSATRITSLTGCRFADIDCDRDHALLFAVCEDHNVEGMPAGRLVGIDIDAGTVTTLCEEHDFYSSPRYNHGTGELAWLCWDLPAMPWDGTILYIAKPRDHGRLHDRRQIAGGPGIAVSQPAWHRDTLYYTSDQTGWSNLYRHDDGPGQALLPMDAEFAEPHWVFGQSCYCFLGDTLLACCNRDGSHGLLTLDLDSLDYRTVDTDFVHFDYLSSDAGTACCIATSPRAPARLVRLDRSLSITGLTQASDPGVCPACISVAVPVNTRSRHGDTIHSLYYPPTSPDSERRPPLIVLSHGGPTGQAHAGFDLKKQFWTTRGFAILDVNYSGSTGYGKAYRQRLADNWGLRDVSDVCDAALSMVERGLADRQRLIIKGSSAGGYTTLSALTFTDVFCAGASYYGISDLEALARDTHKFEARYLDTLVGPWPGQAPIYRERSPIHHSDGLNCPVIFFQGEEDRVVPRAQAEIMVDALRNKGIAVAYRLYPGEQHGFRRADTIIDALESELCFYHKVLGGPDTDCDLEITNYSTRDRKDTH